jgi:predicted  nucleic acid-binding Zn-ribbon protein
MDANDIRDALRQLTDLLPSVAERMAALLAEEAAAKAAADDFLQRAEERQAEASDLLARLETVQQELRTQAAAEVERLTGWEDPSPVLRDPALAFDEKAARHLAPFARAQTRHVGFLRDAFNGNREERLLTRGQHVTTMRFGLEKGGDELLAGSEVAGRGAQTLHELVESARGTLGHEIERFAGDLQAQQNATARDVEALRRDLDGYEAALGARLDRLRGGVQQETDQLSTDTDERITALRSAIDDAVREVGDALQTLEEQTRRAGEEGRAHREAIVPLFEHLEERLPHLRQALEGVREAANHVGIAF